MNPVLILTHNNLDLTRKAVRSVKNQNVENFLIALDNGSTDGTQEYLNEIGMGIYRHSVNAGVSEGWNDGLNHCFLFLKEEYCLVVNNDVVLPAWFYRELLSYDLPFVTGVAVDKMEQIAEKPTRSALDPHPDFSAFLIRRDAWEKVGPFDERMKLYASDCDWHVRAHKAGIKLWKANVPFYHERSSTIRLAPPEERIEIETQANKDRAVFKSIYGCLPGEPAYYELFK